MKRVISLAAVLAFTMGGGVAIAEGKISKQKQESKKEVTSTHTTKQESTCSACRKDRGFYVGAGLGVFKAAKKFKDSTDDSESKKFPKGSPAVMPNLVFGYKFNEHFRADVNWQYRRFKYDASAKEHTGDVVDNWKQSIKANTIFLNAYLDAPRYGIFTPYVTGGVGYSRLKAGNFSHVNTFNVVPSGNGWYNAPGVTSNNFVWNVGFGSKIKLHERWALDVSYRYATLGKVKNKATKSREGGVDVPVAARSKSLGVHEGVLGVIYQF